jgi:hypothetical protein
VISSGSETGLELEPREILFDTGVIGSFLSVSRGSGGPALVVTCGLVAVGARDVFGGGSFLGSFGRLVLKFTALISKPSSCG